MTNKGLVPPNAVEIEKYVLGILINDNKAIDRVLSIIDNEDFFYSEVHKQIFKVILKLYENSLPIDLITISDSLRNNLKLKDIGGQVFLMELSQSITSSAHVEYYCYVLTEKYLARKIISKTNEVTKKLYDPSNDILEQLYSMRREVDELDGLMISKQDVKDSKTAQLDFMESLKDSDIGGLQLPYRDIKEESASFMDGNLIVLAGRPGMGKSAVALNMASYFGKTNVPTVFFSLEMSTNELHKRVLSNELDISFYRLNNKKLSNEESQKIYKYAKRVEEMLLYYDDVSLELNKIVARIKYLVKTKGIKFVVIDYIQIISVERSKGMIREQEISLITRTLKRLAKELKIIILAMAQLSRAVENRPIKRPQLSDLRESGAIEQDADIIILLYRPEYYKVERWDRAWNGEHDLPAKGEIELQFAKYRNGSVFDVRLKFYGDRQRIFDVGQNEINFSNPTPNYEIGKAFERENPENDLPF